MEIADKHITFGHAHDDKIRACCFTRMHFLLIEFQAEKRCFLAFISYFGKQGYLHRAAE
jgi:hypothetical protein